MGLGVFQVVEYPVAPGICRGCGAPFGLRIMVDTGLTGDFCNRPHWNPITEEVDAEVDIALAGTVYFCESCVVNMGNTFGMLSAEKADEMRMIIARWEAVAEDMQEKILGLEKIVDGYRIVGYPVSSVSVDNSPDLHGGDEPESQHEITDDESSTRESNGPDDVSGSDVGGASIGESPVSEPITGEESSGVSTNGSGESGKRRDESSDESSDKPADVLGF